MPDADGTGWTRRTFLRATAVTAAPWWPAARSVAAEASPSRKPNIVFVFADQLRSQALSCYGNRQVRTPHFDRIAREGVRFTNAISTWPVCSPYRAMVLTGLQPLHNGTVTNDTAPRDGLPTIATVCRENGYATGYIGKWHLEWGRSPFVPADRRLGFDYWASRNCSHQHFDSFYCGDTPEQVPLPGYEPEAQARLAVDFIRRHREEPFCLFLSWGPPHDPYRGPDECTARFPTEKLRFRPNVTEAETVRRLLDTGPVLTGERASRRSRIRARIEDDERLKAECLQGYYAATEGLDAAMGTLLRGLDEAGLSGDTIVAFSSDHGDMMGSHRMISKQMPHEESISVPFVLRYPRQVPAGTITDALLGPIDVMPTLLALADLPCPSGIDGLDVSAAAVEGKADQRDALLIMKLMPGGNPWTANGVTTWRGVRTKRFTYARLLDRGPWLLFDNLADPYQLSNLIGHPEHAAAQRRLDELTTRLMAEADDPGTDRAIQDGRQKRLAAFRQATSPTKQEFQLKQGDHLAREESPDIANRPFCIRAVVEGEGLNGVIVAQGGVGSGYSLYVKERRLHFITRHKGPAAEIAATDALPSGHLVLEAELTADGRQVLSVNGRQVAMGKTPGLIPKLPGDGLEVGADEEHPVADYRVPNRFNGVIHEVTIVLGDAK